MSRLPSLSTHEVAAALRKAGFVDAPVRGKGSHRAMARADPDGKVHLVILPQRRDIPLGPSGRSSVRAA